MRIRFSLISPLLTFFLLFLLGCAATTPRHAYKVSDQSRIYEIGSESELEWLDVGNYQPTPPDNLLAKAEPFIPIVREACNQLKIDIAVTMAIIEIESGFNPNNENKSDPSYGLMQLVPELGGRAANKYLYGKDEAPSPAYLYNPRNNIFLGVGYLSLMKNYYYGDVKNRQSRQMCMIGGYNAGPTGTARSFGVTSVDAAVNEINKLKSEEVYDKLINNLPKSKTYDARDYLRKIYETVPKWTFLRFSDKAFYARITELKDAEERVALCKEYIQNSGDVDLLCTAQDIWVEHKRAEAFEYFKSEYTKNPGNITKMFTLGRLLEDPIRRVDIARDIIWFNNNLTLGYRLLLETYVKYLFENRASGDVRNELQRLVKQDRKFFKKLTSLLPRQEYPYEWLYKFEMYSQEYSDARNTLLRARKRGAEWVNSENIIHTNLLAGEYKDVLKEIIANIDTQIKAGTIKSELRDESIRKEYIRTLRSIGAFKPILKFLEKYEKNQRNTEIILELARYYALSGRHEKAFQNIFWALEDLATAHKNSQKCYWQKLSLIDDFLVLYTDSRWAGALKLEAEISSQ